MFIYGIKIYKGLPSYMTPKCLFDANKLNFKNKPTYKSFIVPYKETQLSTFIPETKIAENVTGPF